MVNRERRRVLLRHDISAVDSDRMCVTPTSSRVFNSEQCNQLSKITLERGEQIDTTNTLSSSWQAADRITSLCYDSSGNRKYDPLFFSIYSQRSHICLIIMVVFPDILDEF
jgi:hypothetical protein